MQLLLVTFDLTKTIPGDPRYAQADATLNFSGTLFKPLKQNRFLLTSREPQQIMAAIEQRIGRQSGILIMPVTNVSAWRIHELHNRQEWDRLIVAIRKSGIKIEGITQDYVSS